jgi:hypothetical protein
MAVDDVRFANLSDQPGSESGRPNGLIGRHLHDGKLVAAKPRDNISRAR